MGTPISPMISLLQLIPVGVAIAWLFTMPAKGATVATVSGSSTSGAIAWSINPVNGDLMLINASGSSTPKKLCGTINSANVEVAFSPDDKYVFVSDGGPSVGIHVTLYKRSSGLVYSAVGGIDFDLAVQRLAMEVLYGVKKLSGEVLDHSYLECTGWSKDGKRALLQLSCEGIHDGKKISISGFKCSFDPAALVFSTAK